MKLFTIMQTFTERVFFVSLRSFHWPRILPHIQVTMQNLQELLEEQAQIQQEQVKVWQSQIQEQANVEKNFHSRMMKCLQDDRKSSKWVISSVNRTAKSLIHPSCVLGEANFTIYLLGFNVCGVHRNSVCVYFKLSHT